MQLNMLSLGIHVARAIRSQAYRWDSTSRLRLPNLEVLTSRSSVREDLDRCSTTVNNDRLRF